MYQQKKEVARQSLGLEECTFSPRINDRQPKLRQPLYDYEEIGKFHFSFFSFFFIFSVSLFEIVCDAVNSHCFCILFISLYFEL